MTASSRDISESAPCQGDVPWLASMVTFLSSCLRPQFAAVVSSLFTLRDAVSKT